MAIFGVVLLNAVIGYLQRVEGGGRDGGVEGDGGGEANVVRDGESRSIPAAEIVPGDLFSR